MHRHLRGQRQTLSAGPVVSSATISEIEMAKSTVSIEHHEVSGNPWKCREEVDEYGRLGTCSEREATARFALVDLREGPSQPLTIFHGRRENRGKKCLTHCFRLFVVYFRDSECFW